MNGPPIVGAWEVNAPNAPFPWHVMTFAPDGTMSQSNPPAGNRDHSDSGGHGVWVSDDSGGTGTETVVNARFVEFKAHRETGRYIGKGVIVLTLKVVADEFTGTSDAYRYDATGSAVGGPSTSPVTGVRITLAAPAAGSTR